MVREAYFVPENKKLDDLLDDFRARKNHLAIVVDEYGGTSGIVTLQDVIEEIVGDINDNPPVFPQPTYTHTTEENMPIGSSVFEVVAEDLDIGENARLRVFDLNRRGWRLLLHGCNVCYACWSCQNTRGWSLIHLHRVP